MAYFDRFPLMAYDVAADGNYKLLPDILRRVKLRSGLRSGSYLFDSYDVQDGERPEDIAFKLYGDAELHWIVLMTNNVTDRYYQWPLTQPQFQEHLTDKYGAGNEDAKFKTYGCGSAIASSSLLTEWVKGKTLDEARAIKNIDIVEELSLPPVKIHCSVLAEDAIKSAIKDYTDKNRTHR